MLSHRLVLLLTAVVLSLCPEAPTLIGATDVAEPATDAELEKILKKGKIAKMDEFVFREASPDD